MPVQRAILTVGDQTLAVADLPLEQGALFDAPLSAAPRPLRCAGGCDCEDVDLCETPGGQMCEQCIADLYTECEDCQRMLRYDDWGECEDLQIGPDDRRRCRDCDRTVFSICTYCGRRTLREGGDVCSDPDRGECCRSCWDNCWFNCSGCRDIFSRQEAFPSPSGNLAYCEECFERNYFQCSACGCSRNRDDAHGWDGDPYCNECYGNADTWKVQPWSGHAAKFDRIGSKRCYGVELETASCSDHRELHGQTEWGCVYECSTSGREMVSPILQGDEGFAEIRKMCAFAERKEWTLDTNCGLHVHIDARDLSSQEMLQIAYAYRRSYPLWKRFVSRRRSDYSMCGSPQYSPADVRAAEHFEDFAESRDRFEFVNWRSFLRHGSIEVRIYKGSLNAREVCNWVALHTRFIDAVKDLTFDEIDDVLGGITRKNWRGLVELVGDPKLLDYWRRIAAQHKNTLPALWDGADDADADDDDDDGVLVYPEDHCGRDNCSSCDRTYGRPSRE